jgi:predicted enzyme related to lactoylglutathione lyase
MANNIVWADIPVADLPRAMAFYTAVTGDAMMMMPGSDDNVAIFSEGADGPTVSFDLYVGEPSAAGPTIYLSSNGDIDGLLDRVIGAGGMVLEEKRFMGDMVGWIAFFQDSEGNRIGVQQPG